MFFQMNNHSNKSNPTRITSRIPRILLTVCLPLLSLISQNWIICWFTSMELKIFWWFEFLWNSIHDCNHFWLFLNHFPPSFPFPFLQTMADKSDDGSMVTRVFVPRLGVKKTVRLNPVIPSSHILFNERFSLVFFFFFFSKFPFSDWHCVDDQAPVCAETRAASWWDAELWDILAKSRSLFGRTENFGFLLLQR